MKFILYQVLTVFIQLISLSLCDSDEVLTYKQVKEKMKMENFKKIKCKTDSDCPKDYGFCYEDDNEILSYIFKSKHCDMSYTCYGEDQCIFYRNSKLCENTADCEKFPDKCEMIDGECSIKFNCENEGQRNEFCGYFECFSDNDCRIGVCDNDHQCSAMKNETTYICSHVYNKLHCGKVDNQECKNDDECYSEQYINNLCDFPLVGLDFSYLKYVALIILIGIIIYICYVQIKKRRKNRDYIMTN